MALQQTIHLTQDQRLPYPIMDAVQNDTGRTLKMILDDVTVVSTDTAKLYVKRSDGSYYNWSCTNAYSNNAFTADITQALTKAGSTECQLRVTASSEDVSTFTFIIRVQEATDGVPSVEQLGYTIEEIVAFAQAAEDSADEAQAIAEAARSRYSRLKLSIIGDSIDTFDEDGYKIPGYNMYYPALGVTDVNQTWWMQVINNSGMTLEVNASWSGSRVTNTHSDPTYPDFYDRVSVLGSPQIIFVTLGTNDSSNNVALGDYDFETTYTSLSEATFRTAYIKGVKALQATYENATIVCITENMKKPYKDSIIHIAKTLGVEYIDATPYYTGNNVHPGVRGMREIAANVLYPTDKALKFSNVPADGLMTGLYIDDLIESTRIIKMSEPYKYITTGASASTPVDMDVPVNSSYPWRYAVVECSPGDAFTINSSGGNAPRAWCFVDSDGYPVKRALQNESSTYELIYAPEDAAYLVVNDMDGLVSYYGVVENPSPKPKNRTRLDEVAYVDLLALGYEQAISSFCVVDNQLLMFVSSNDEHTNYAGILIWDIDATTGLLTYNKYLLHNFGHANTVSYCPQNDTLVLGNGGSSSNTQNAQIYIIEDFSALLLSPAATQLTLSSVAKTIDVESLGWGKQLNVLWANSNLGGTDMVYAICNDGYVQYIRLLQLGKGSNTLANGTAVAALEDEFNCTFKVIDTWKRPYTTDIALNDAQSYAGKLYTVSGHSAGLHIEILTLKGNKEIASEEVLNYVYDGTGTAIPVVTEGIAIHNGLMYLGAYYYTNNAYQKLGVGLFRV